jgi:accessory colonization factor AcfC
MATITTTITTLMASFPASISFGIIIFGAGGPHNYLVLHYVSTLDSKKSQRAHLIR